MLERRPIGEGGGVKKPHMRQQKNLWAVSGMWWGAVSGIKNVWWGRLEVLRDAAQVALRKREWNSSRY